MKHKKLLPFLHKTQYSCRFFFTMERKIKDLFAPSSYYLTEQFMEGNWEAICLVVKSVEWKKHARIWFIILFLKTDLRQFSEPQIHHM